MSAKRLAPSVSGNENKRQRRMLTIVEKVQLLDMLKEGRSFAAVGRHYGINESSVRYIKKDEKNIRMTAAVSFNKNAKRVVTNRNKKIVRMESALALWISEEAGLTLDRLATLVRMAKDLQRLAQEWDPHMLRSLQFANTIEGGMTVYKNLLTQNRKCGSCGNSGAEQLTGASCGNTQDL